MHPVRGADRTAVAVAHHDEDVQVGAVELDAGGDRKSAAVDAVKAVRLEVVGEPARAADARDEHRLLRFELFGNEQFFDRREDRVITAARAPSGNRPLVVAEDVFVVIVNRNGAAERRTREVGHDTSLL